MPCTTFNKRDPFDWEKYLRAINAISINFLRESHNYALIHYLYDKTALALTNASLQEHIRTVGDYLRSDTLKHLSRDDKKKLQILKTNFERFEAFYTEFATLAECVKQTLLATRRVMFGMLTVTEKNVYRFFLNTLRSKVATVTDDHVKTAQLYAVSIFVSVTDNFIKWEECATHTFHKIFEYVYDNGSLPQFEPMYQYFLTLVTDQRIQVPPNYKILAEKKIRFALQHIDRVMSLWWNNTTYPFLGHILGDSLVFHPYNPPSSYGFGKPLRAVFEKLAQLQISIKLPAGQRVEPPPRKDNECYNRGIEDFQTKIINGDEINIHNLLSLLGRAFRESEKCELAGEDVCDQYIDAVIEAFYHYFTRLVVHEDSSAFYTRFYGQDTRQEFNWDKVKPIFFNDKNFLGEYAPEEKYPRLNPKRAKKSLTVWNVIEIFTGLFDNVYDTSLIQRLFGH